MTKRYQHLTCSARPPPASAAALCSGLFLQMYLLLHFIYLYPQNPLHLSHLIKIFPDPLHPPHSPIRRVAWPPKAEVQGCILMYFNVFKCLTISQSDEWMVNSKVFYSTQNSDISNLWIEYILQNCQAANCKEFYILWNSQAANCRGAGEVWLHLPCLSWQVRGLPILTPFDTLKLWLQRLRSPFLHLEGWEDRQF